MTGAGAATSLLPRRLGPGPFAVETVDLRKRWGSERALDGVDLQVPEGSVYVLVGPNGAGKSTLLRVLMGLTRATGGEASVLGREPWQGSGARPFIGYVPEGHALGYGWMTVGRLVEHHARYRPGWDASYVRRLLSTYDVKLARKCRGLSKGESRRVQLLLALAHRPRLLLLDEPTDGLDHVIRDETLGLLSEHLADTPTTVLISTHRVYEVERLVDHVGVLSGGRLLGQLSRDALHEGLLRYWADVPEGWESPAGLDGVVVRRGGGARTVELTVWGDRERVLESLTASGAVVRDATPLSIDDAATALLARREHP